MESLNFDYDFTDSPTLMRCGQSDKFIRAIKGPFGSGKSSFCVQEIIRRAKEQKPGPDGIRRTRWAVIRNTFPQLNDTTIKTFHEWYPPNIFGTYNSQFHNYTINVWDDCHIEIMFRSLDSDADIKKLLSLELTGAWVNECREVPWSVIDALTGRVGRYPAMKDGGPTWYGVIMDTNPPDEESDFYRVLEEQRPANAEIFSQPSGLSPQAENKTHLVPNYYENLCTGKSQEWVKVYVEGQYGFIIEGAPVYAEYNDQAHCNDKIKPNPMKPIRRGWDFGLTPACEFSQLQVNGQWYVFDELYATRMGIENFSQEVKDYCARNYSDFKFEDDFCDPAGNTAKDTDEKTCFDIMRAKGFNPKPGELTLQRIESVRKALTTLVDGKPMFQLHPRCKRLRKGFMGGYHYAKRQSTHELKPDPEKNAYSHIHDALQYDASRLFGAGLKPKTEQKTYRSPVSKGRTWASA